MSKEIKAEGRSLAKIFNSDFEFNIPSYQRPYAWTTDHASNLFDDLYDFYKSNPTKDYFLGSIVLIKEEGRPKAEVIDGQQRLTTLTILLSCIASIFKDGSAKDKLKNYILEGGHEFEGREEKPRLTIRDKDNNFFRKYVQSLACKELQEVNSQQLENESQKLIQKNSAFFINRIKTEFFDDTKKLTKFITFLMTRCFLVAISAPNKLSASNVFSVMNSRGLNLQTTDILKAEIIGNLDSDNMLNRNWEDMESVLGRENFNNLFIYIRMIRAKKKLDESILKEFKKYVWDDKDDPDNLINAILKPHCDALVMVQGSAYKTNPKEIENTVNNQLEWLNKIDNSDWIPPAIQFLSQIKNKPDYVSYFFKKLERLSAYLYICSKSGNKRIERYAEVIKEVENDHNLQNPPQSLELTSKEMAEMLDTLSGDIYDLPPRKRNYIIFRLDNFMSEENLTYNTKTLTIEHVLPQNPDKDSQWLKLWEEEEREEWLHKLANLALLNRSRNAQARNYDFNAKKEIYLKGNTGLSTYPLTMKAYEQTRWTPDVLKRRQAELIKVLKDEWELN